jgi:uncharacterized protein
MVRWEIELLGRYFTGDALKLIVAHALAVAGLAGKIADKCGLSESDSLFVEQASLLHDVGVCRVHAPDIGMAGDHDYIMHGVLGREILEKEGYPLHALVCERHTGVGLTITDIVSQGLPLPHRDMTPQTLPEQIICFADLFYSKKPGKLSQQKEPQRVRRKLQRFGEDKVQIFDRWMERFWPL